MAAPKMPASRNQSDWPDAVARRDKRIDELEAALRLIAQKSEVAVDYLKNSGEFLFLQYAQGALDTARAALDGKPLPFAPKK